MKHLGIRLWIDSLLVVFIRLMFTHKYVERAKK